MKDKKVIIAVLALVLIIALVIFVVNKPNNSSNNNSTNTKENHKNEKPLDENNVTKGKKIDDLDVDIKIEKGKETIDLFLTIINSSLTEDVAAFSIYVIPLDGDGNELDKIETNVPEILKNDSVTIFVDITEYYGKVKDVKIIKK